MLTYKKILTDLFKFRFFVPSPQVKGNQNIDPSLHIFLFYFFLQFLSLWKLKYILPMHFLFPLGCLGMLILQLIMLWTQLFLLYFYCFCYITASWKEESIIIYEILYGWNQHFYYVSGVTKKVKQNPWNYKI